MKYAIIIPDGCADEPQETLGGETPLAAANTPQMDNVARQGIVGRSNNVPAHLTAGSAVANMSLLGYDANEHFTGRAPLEAAAQGIDLGPDDWAIRCNLVTVEDQIMRDFTAGHISTDDATQLLASLQEAVAQQYLEFVPGVSYRNLLLFRGAEVRPPFTSETSGTPPHDLTDKPVIDDFPRGAGSDLLSELMERSIHLFADHDVNQRRRANNQLPATNVWLWGLGKTPKLTPFQDLHGITGKMITAVDLLRGLAALIGWDRIEVPGATGYTDTDYAAKGAYAIESLSDTDLICVHIEAPDEASHEGDIEGKIESLEEIDRHIVGPLHQALREQGDYRLMISPDHPTFIRTKTHSHGYVPWTICGAGIAADQYTKYSEDSSKASSSCFAEGYELMSFFVDNASR